MGFWKKIFRLEVESTPVQLPALPPAPSSESIITALQNVVVMVSAPGIPATIYSRSMRIVDLIQNTLPRLENLGLGSYDAYQVMATATNYLPEALSAYLRLPRDWADTRPVQGHKTSLILLIDQLDLLSSTMDDFYDAANRTDANALITHGEFLRAKFGSTPNTSDLKLPQSVATTPILEAM